MSNQNFKVKNSLEIGVPNGTPPIITNSTTKVNNLNADLLDGFDSTYFAYADSTYTKVEIDTLLLNYSTSSVGTGNVEVIREVYVATAGQTVFNLTNRYDLGNNSLGVYIQGIKQFPGAYTETSRTSVTFSQGLNAGDYVLFELGKPQAAGALNQEQIESISCSGYNIFSCVISGKLFTGSGSESYGTISLGNNLINQHARVGLDNMTQVIFPGYATVVKSSTYGYSGYALLSDGSLYAWGQNNNGQLGLGHTTVMSFPTLSATGVKDYYVHGSNGAISLDQIRCFITKTDGFLYGCGYNGYGALGDGTTVNKSTWTKVTTFAADTVQKVFNLGATYGCTFVLTTLGKIYACGYRGYYQLGDGTGTAGFNATFTDVTVNWSGSPDVKDIKVTGGFGFNNGTTYSYANVNMLITYLDDTTVVKTAGYAGYGSLGNGTTTNSTNLTLPFTVINSNTLDIIDISSHGGINSCFMLCKNGDVYAWGYNGYGQLGNGNTTQQQSPVKVLTNVAKLPCDGWDMHTYSHYQSSFLIKLDGSVWATGYNPHGQLGIGSTTNISTFQQVQFPNNEAVIDVGQWASSAANYTVVFKTLKSNLYMTGYAGQYNLTYGVSNNVTVPHLVRLPKVN